MRVPERVRKFKDDIPALVEGPTPASKADGTCAWYRKTGLASRSLFADQVLESRTDARVWDERCALVLSEGRAADLHLDHVDEMDGIDKPDRPGQYFASFHTYSGESAKNIRLPDPAGDETPGAAEPGKAGRSTGDTVWWASSACAGKPQIHTMTLSYGYDEIVTRSYQKVFRAYVDDVTGRRGCTNIKFPSSSTFRADWERL